MLTVRIIPCLDVRDGRVVKGVRFQNLRDAGDPAERARFYEETGADEIAILDVAATPEGRANQAETIAAVRAEISLPISAGGGVRNAEDAAQLLRSGADKVVVNSAAVARPELLRELAERFGRQCVVLALDAKRLQNDPREEELTWQLRTRSGTRQERIDATDWAAQGAELGAGEILLTSWDRDGTRAGYDTALIEAVRAVVNVPVIASGGAASAAHMVQACSAGADAVLAASIFHDDQTTVADVKRQLAKLGLEVRD
jgi:imidazoleglycerol phosphate synthase cyclase subunit